MNIDLDCLIDEVTLRIMNESVYQQVTIEKVKECKLSDVELLYRLQHTADSLPVIIRMLIVIQEKIGQ